MIRRELATVLSGKLHLPASTIAQVLELELELLLEELIRTGRLEWRGFGSFTVRTYPAREIHNPATGQTIALQPRKGVAFKPSQKLKKKLEPPAAVRSGRRRDKRLVTRTTKQSAGGHRIKPEVAR